MTAEPIPEPTIGRLVTVKTVPPDTLGREIRAPAMRRATVEPRKPGPICSRCIRSEKRRTIG